MVHINSFLTMLKIATKCSMRVTTKKHSIYQYVRPAAVESHLMMKVFSTQDKKVKEKGENGGN